MTHKDTAIDSYDLNAPPVAADLTAHATALSTHAFSIKPSTMSEWPITMSVINGRRQPLTAEVWAYALALLPTEQLQSALILRMGEQFRNEVEALLPAAIDAWVAGQKMRPGRGGHRRRAATKGTICSN